MPKEQGHFGERVARNTSKNAKDKSNSATLRASQGGAHRDQSRMGNMSNRMLRCDSEKDSEKDSGYSEAGSDSVQTDVDDQRSSVSARHRESSKGCNNNNAHNMAPYEELTPIYVIENLVVKPSRPEQLLHSPLAWGGGWHSLTGAKAPTQLLLIQQPAMPAPSSSTSTPSSTLAKPQGQIKKGGSRSNKNHSSKTLYLPILNSYPRIAPHPRKESHEGMGASGAWGVMESGSEGQSQSKRVCTEEGKKEAVSTTSHLPKPQQQHHQKEGRVHSHSHSQYKARGGHSSFPNPSHCPLPGRASSTTQPKFHHSHQSSRSDSMGSPSVSSSQTPYPHFSSDSPPSSCPSSSSSSSSVAHSPYRPAPEAAVGSSLSDSQPACSSMRQRRFLNTAEILNQSGLLAITLRTKELLKQSAATEREIAQLRQHTNLLCQVAQAGQHVSNEGSNSLEKLLQAMTKSGSYPSLDFNQLKGVSNSHQQSKRRGEDDKEKDRDGRNIKTHNNPPRNPMSLRNIEDETSPPSPLFAPSPEAAGTEHPDSLLDFLSASLSASLPGLVPQHGHRQASMDKDLTDLTMSPESSTHNKYLL
ncbi:CLOCK-interacting pacemaker-like [Centroberyx gerrardi]